MDDLFTISLKVIDRLTILQILPNESDLMTIRIVRSLQDELSFTEEEHSKLNFVVNNNVTNWDDSTDILKEFKFAPKALSIIKKAFSDFVLKLDKEGKLTNQFLSVAEKFIDLDSIAEQLEMKEKGNH